MGEAVFSVSSQEQREEADPQEAAECVEEGRRRACHEVCVTGQGAVGGPCERWSQDGRD